MDAIAIQSDEIIRKIEDIIDIQMANGNFNTRQVAFDLPSEVENPVSANIAKSLESGLSNTKSEGIRKKKIKKTRSKRYKSPLPDVISWPSDSDITVLRMKLCLTTELKDNVGKEVPGDGLHHPDSSSMVNLATLMNRPQASKQSVNIEEYLLPLTSWERGQEELVTFQPKILPESVILPILGEKEKNRATSSRPGISKFDDDYEYRPQDDKKSKMARFLRLYFCPCCTCLYKMENMSDEPSTYRTKHKEQKDNII